MKRRDDVPWEYFAAEARKQARERGTAPAEITLIVGAWSCINCHKLHTAKDTECVNCPNSGGTTLMWAHRIGDVPKVEKDEPDYSRPITDEPPGEPNDAEAEDW